MKTYGPAVAHLDNKAFRVCLCCHVKTGTLLYGILVAAVHIIFLGLLILAAIHPDVLKPEKQEYDDFIVADSKSGDLFQNYDEPRRQQLTKDNMSLMFGITLVCLVATLALIYGVARNTASYVMPFFCLQVFDFCLSCLTAVGCFTYAPNIKQWIIDNGMQNYPFMDRLMCLDNDNLMLLFVTGLILLLSGKAYLIGMVWSCYKYIQLFVASRAQMREYTMNDDILLPPCYEDAIKGPANYQAPPPYERE